MGRLWVLGLALLLALMAPWARADEDPPGRVGRLADFNGSVSWWDSDTGAWAEAERNRPLTSGDRVSTAQSGRAELRVGSTVLRLAAGTEFEVLRLDDERLVFQLHSGGVALRVRSRELADELELVTDEARLRPLRAGHYLLQRTDDTTTAGAWRGEWHVRGERGDDGLVVGPERWAELYRVGRRGEAGELRSAWVAPRDDGFTRWAQNEDARDERSASTRYVSPEMTGVEDLDRHGRWEQHPEYGALWLPLVVRADWAPYRHGRWAWVRPWGWTWIDEAPWGFAPFHYGRWVNWRGRWGWVPGAYVARPMYAPALVAWVGGSGWGVSVRIGSPAVGWLPLAPRDIFQPHYRHTPRYVERVNPAPPYRWRHAPGQVPTGPISYGNQGVPNAVTVVPGDVLVRRQPVAGAVVLPPRSGKRAPLVGQAPPDGPTFIGPQAPRPVSPGGGWRGEQVQRPERPERPERPDVPRRPDFTAPVLVAPGGALPRPAPPADDGRAVRPAEGERRVRDDGRGEERRDAPRDDRREDRRDDRGDNRRDDRREDRREPRRPEPAAGPVMGPALPRVQAPAAPTAPPAAAPRPAPVRPPAMGPQRPVQPERNERPSGPAPSERANTPDRQRDRQDMR
ncbi:hypothetical protein IP87_17850 [beta proteobacterium AAP121]|nr:hypothetical protein IP80_10830 [beta proteobacterium AAP65]KPF95016.1 hypothetical protein IP87_17850 [beta proteobacterium AAP121]